MDMALDTAGNRMFYRGSAHIPRSFLSEDPFPLRLDLKSWGNAAENTPSQLAESLMTESFEEDANFQPLGDNRGVISAADGRLLFRGEIRKEGLELDGDWFLDGKYGGGFRITAEGVLFP